MAGCRGFALAIGVSALLALTGGVAEANQVAVIPAPAALHAGGRPFTLTRDTRIVAKTRAAQTVAEQLADVLRPSTGYRLPVVAHGHGIELRIARGTGGREGYQLRSGRDGVELRAGTAAGLFHGVQTLRQLLPARIESPTVQRGPWTVAGRAHRRPAAVRATAARCSTSPGTSSRVAEVERYIDELALYKINTLHLHLSDDQGWRIAIDKLAAAGDLRRQHRGRRRPGRLLHARPTTRADPLRRGPLHDDRARDRHARPHQRGARLVRRAQLRRRRAAAVHRAPRSASARCASRRTLTYTFLDDVIGELAAHDARPVPSTSAVTRRTARRTRTTSRSSTASRSSCTSTAR